MLGKNKNSNQEEVRALKKARGTDKLLEGDLSIDVGFFDNKGKHDTNQYIRWVTGFYFTSVSVITSAYLGYMDATYNNNSFNTFSDIKKFTSLGFDWWYYNTKGFVGIGNADANLDYKLVLGASLFVGTALTTWLVKKQKFKADVQSFLASCGLSQYYLKSYDKKTRTAYFKLIRGEQSNFKGFMDNADNFKQMFGVGNLKTGREDKTGVELQFLEETPMLIAKYKGKDYTMMEQAKMVADGIQTSEFKIVSTCKRTDFSKELIGTNKSLLGVEDINGKPLYASFPQTVGMLQGHYLIAGGTGSGKSFMISNWIKSALMGDTAQFIDEIIVINMKEDSPDWEFLKDYEKASLYTGVEEALVALKKAELKMLANNRWNNVYGHENTNYGQTIIIIDEIHKFQLLASDRTIPQALKLIVNKCLTIIDTLATQARSANVFLVGILQKATLDQLSGTYRSNCMNRILLKSDKISSDVVIDEEVKKENMINDQKITSGQFVYYNMQNGIISHGFAVEAVEWDVAKANSLEENPILIEGRKQAKELIELAKIVAKLKADKAEIDKEDKEFSKKVNSYDDIEVDTRDYWGEAQEIMNGEKEYEPVEVKEDKEVEEYKSKLKKNKSFMKEEEKPYETKVEIKKEKVIKEEASDEETEEFMKASDEVMDMEEKLEKFEDLEKEADKKIEELKKIEENPREELKDKLSEEEITVIEKEIEQSREDITIDI
jgi:hypothetical protein